MSERDPFNLSSIWAAALEVYNEVAAICNRHGLRYYVTDGSAIGAIRHSGFIPWDDDLDLSMPRPDYEKFKQIARSELPSYLKFVNYENSPEFQFLFGKVQDCRREKVELIEQESGRSLSNGIFVDIFPIDGYPRGGFPRLWMRLRTLLMIQANVTLSFNFFELAWTMRLRWMVGLPFIVMFGSVIRNRRERMKKFERILMENPFEESMNTGRCECRLTLLRKPPLPRAVWGNGVYHEYHTQKVRIPTDCNAYLRNEYGDYMQLPPERERHPTHEYAERCPWWLGPTHLAEC